MTFSRIAQGLAAVALFILSASSPVWADTRFFIPELHMGPSRDTQLVINNKGDHEESLDIWVIQKSGRLLGQVQLNLASHSTKTLALTESFGGQTVDFAGWLTAFARNDNVDMSYTFTGSNPATFDARRAPSREMSLSVTKSGGTVLRVSNTSGLRNQIVIKGKDQNGRPLVTSQIAVPPYGQVEVPLQDKDTKEASSLDLWGESDFLAVIGEALAPNASASTVSPDSSEQLISLVIDSSIPVGAYQITLRFNPNLLQFSSSDIQGGLSAGFTSRPLAVGIDNTKGELRLAAFQVGSSPVGKVEVARIHAKPISGAELMFGIGTEEVADVTGASILSTNPSVRLFLSQ